MTTLRSLWAALAAALLIAASQLGASMPASASAATPPVPSEIAAPEGATLLLSSHARGVQIYECKDDQWVFHAPRALLFDSTGRRAIGTHYGGIDRGLTA